MLFPLFLSILFYIPSSAAKTEIAIFAMGCFWCGEEAMEQVPGVLSAKSGYVGGTT